jgi:Uma2 family endonuclease
MELEDPRIHKLTVEDYWSLPDDGRRYEILEGMLEVTPSPVYEHQNTSGNLFTCLGVYLRLNPVGKLIAAPMDVILAPDLVCQPDLLFIRRERVADIVRDRIWGAPDLVIEILSPATAKRDRITKAQLYARHGVGEYWVVDHGIRRVWRQVLANGAYSAAEEFRPGEKLTSQLFPGLELEVDAIFAS